MALWKKAAIIGIFVGASASWAVNVVRADDEHAPIHHAKRLLEDAQRKLEERTQGYGGHRRAALDHIEQALHSIDAALEYSHTHLHGE